MSSVMYALLKSACKSRNRKSFLLHLRILYYDDANPRDAEGNTVAHLCYLYNYIDGVCMLMEEGIETHMLNFKNETPLHIACEKNYDSLVRWHLDNNSKEEDYRAKDNRSSYTPSMWLVMNGNVPLLQRFAERGYVDPEAETNYRRNTHFTLAFQMDRVEVARFLYDHGLQGKHGLNKPRRGGISLACDIVHYSKTPSKTFDLLDQWGKLDIMLAVDESGKTPLAYCVDEFRKNTLICMVKRGFARPNTEINCSLYAAMSELERSLLRDLLWSEIDTWELFLRGFLSLTIRLPSQEKKNEKKQSFRNDELIRSLDCGTNKLVADFVGVTYGEKLMYVKELIVFLQSI